MSAPFTGFGERAVDFYDGLLADNTKAYWTDHRAVYDADVRGPMEALLAALGPEFGPGRIFRPHRDVRFATDKSPYKTACGATVGPHYVQVSADGLLAASGHYHWAPDQVARYRAAVDDARRGDDLAARLAAVTATAVDGALHTAATAERVAATWRAAAPLVEWLDANVRPAELRPT